MDDKQARILRAKKLAERQRFEDGKLKHWLPRETMDKLYAIKRRTQK